MKKKQLTPQQKWNNNHKSKLQVYQEHSEVRRLLRDDDDAKQLKWLLAEMNKAISSVQVPASVIIVPNKVANNLVKRGIAERK